MGLFSETREQVPSCFVAGSHHEGGGSIVKAVPYPLFVMMWWLVVVGWAVMPIVIDLLLLLVVVFVHCVDAVCFVGSEQWTRRVDTKISVCVSCALLQEKVSQKCCFHCVRERKSGGGTP